jgi:hypothetical protein
MAHKKSDCPSSVASLNSKIIGVKMDGQVHILPQTLPVSKEFFDNSHGTKSHLEDFRFTGKCIEHGCKQWSGGTCGVVTRVLQTFDAIPGYKLSPCAIRDTCRWHQQEGINACAVCDQVSYVMS